MYTEIKDKISSLFSGRVYSETARQNSGYPSAVVKQISNETPAMYNKRGKPVKDTYSITIEAKTPELALAKAIEVEDILLVVGEVWGSKKIQLVEKVSVETEADEITPEQGVSQRTISFTFTWS